MQRILDVVEKVGNKAPHPVVIFPALIALVVVLSHVFHMLGTTASAEVLTQEEKLVPATSLEGYPYAEELSLPHKPHVETIAVRSLPTVDGLRFVYVSLIPSFMSFTGLGLIIVAMIGVGVAEEAGLVGALIRKLVILSPHWALAYILAKDADGATAGVKFEASHAYPPFDLADDAPVVRRAKQAAESIGMRPTTLFSNGGLDANWLVKHGLPTLTIGAGQYEVHTVKEYVHLPEFASGCRLAVALATLEA
jgi:hypothetical protein